jgi:hypothetical protein
MAAEDEKPAMVPAKEAERKQGSFTSLRRLIYSSSLLAVRGSAAVYGETTLKGNFHGSYLSS